MDAKLFERLKETEPGIWELPKTFRKRMKVPVRVVATEKLLKDMDNGAFEQAVNVSELPGIIEASYMMPDAHWGYGFPIGGVAAFDLDRGVISPGGIGFDINCGMRLLVTNFSEADIKPRIVTLINSLFNSVPTGIGRGGAVRLSTNELKDILVKGASWAVEHGLGWSEDLEHIEENGKIAGVDPKSVTDRAIKRGINQLGTLGAGNHYLEVQKVETIYDPKIALEFGITNVGQVTVMVHCGSRGLGHQVATDYLHVFERAMKKYGIAVSDQQLACTPFNSIEGQRYYSAMAGAANFAFCNREVISHKVREVFANVFGRSAESCGMNLVYDVAHNIAKIEKFEVDGKRIPKQVHSSQGVKSGQDDKAGMKSLPALSSSKIIAEPKKTPSVSSWDELDSNMSSSFKGYPTRKSGEGVISNQLLVHRKGATRSYPGQPVIIGGSMETGSYLLVGTEASLQKTFGSTAHGSGRTMSRTQAKKQVRGYNLQEKMREKGIYVRSASYSGLAEEAGLAYKDINEVVKAVFLADISQPVASFTPMGNIKG